MISRGRVATPARTNTLKSAELLKKKVYNNWKVTTMNKMMNEPQPLNIIAYTDGTHKSVDAVRSAMRLARAAKAELDIIHVADAPIDPSNLPQPGIPVPRAEWGSLHSCLRHLTIDVISWLAAESFTQTPEAVICKHEGPDLYRLNLDTGKPVRLWLSYDEPNIALEKLVKKYNADLVVIRGEETGILKRILGKSVAEVAALKLPASILVVRSPVYPDTPFVVASDGSESSRRAFGILRKLMPAIRKPIDIILKEGIDGSAIEDWLKESGKNGETLRLDEIGAGLSPLRQLLFSMQPGHVLVVGASMRSYLLRFLQGSVPLSLVRRAPFSVLVSKEIPGLEEDY